jgi:hypothetical protein
MFKGLLRRSMVTAFASAALAAAATPPPLSRLSFSAVVDGHAQVLAGGTASVNVSFKADGEARYSMLSTASVWTDPWDPSIQHVALLDRTNCLPADTDTSCTVHVRFTPAAAGTRSLQLHFTWSDPSGSGFRVVDVEAATYVSLLPELYDTILHRAPDPAGESFWTVQINRSLAAGIPIADVWRTIAESLFNSAEYRQRANGDAQYIADLYLAFLGREPAAAELAYWSAQLSAGLPRDTVRASFELSTEFTRLMQAINGWQPGTATGVLLPGFYRGLLARLPDAEGYIHWSNVLGGGPSCQLPWYLAAADEVSRAFMESPEYAARARSDAEFVGDLYNAFLARGGDVAGIRYWAAKLETNALTREQVRQAFLHSAEFTGRVDPAVLWGCAVVA